MNHSFKKNIAFTFLTLGGILSLSSCKDSDMEVFVAQDTRNQKLIEAIKAIPEPKKEVADEDIEEDKDYIYLMPDGYTDYIDSNNGSRGGYYGYVDLGLSVKWATNNFNNPLNYNDGNISANDLYKKEQEKITYVERPGTKEYNQQYPAVMSYDEYLEYIDMEKLQKEYYAYDSYVTKMKNAYNSAVRTFHYNAVNFYQHIKELGGRYAWGALSDWPQVSNSDKNSPQNIAGNTKYDVVTKYMGKDWHIPTKAEWQELIDKCQWEDHDTYWLITGPSGKRIILPHYSRDYNTSDRANTMTDSEKYYDVYEFDTETKTIIQCEAARRCILIRPVYTK